MAAIPTSVHPFTAADPTATLAAESAQRVRARALRPVLLASTLVLLLSSFLLDGHTITTNPRAAVIIADLAHTIAASVWIGGVLLLAVLLLGRARQGVPTGAAEMAIRFSIPATAAVAIVGVTGATLTLLILDQPAELATTNWGRTLTMKIVLVGVVALVGLYNNKRVLPTLDERALDPTRQLRRTIAVEAGIMLGVLLITAVLVNAAT